MGHEGWNQPASSSLQGKQAGNGAAVVGPGIPKLLRTPCPQLPWVCLWPVAELMRLDSPEGWVQAQGTPWTWACFSGWSGQDQPLGAAREARGIVLRFAGSPSQAQTLYFPDLECEGLL